MDAELEEIEGEIEVETGAAMEVEEEASGLGLSSSACSSFPSIVSLFSAIFTLDFLGAGPALEREGEGEGALAFFRELDMASFFFKMQCIIQNVLDDFERNIFFYDSMGFHEILDEFPIR